MSRAMIFTGRLQPLHWGHVNFWLHCRQLYSEHLIICILRNSRPLQRLATQVSDPKTYVDHSRLAFALDRNPLPNWERLRLANIAIESQPKLHGNTTIILRNRPDISWEDSLVDLPQDRVWLFREDGLAFTNTKIEFYRTKGEEVRTVQFSDDLSRRATDIRAQWKGGNLDLSFLPEACHPYFRGEVVPYLTK
jgi:hypothetical protein